MTRLQQLLPQARRALRRAALAAQEHSATTAAPLAATRLMSTATATRPAESTATATTELKEALKAKIPVEQERLKALKKSIGAKEIGKVTVDMCLGGMRGIPVRRLDRR